MGTEVQFKMFLPGYHFANDVNERAGNKSLLLSYDNSNMKNGNQFNGFSRWSKPDLQFRCEKEELRQIILTQESIFRHQINELHRLYKIQRDLMNEIKSKDLSRSLVPAGPFPSSLFSSSDKRKQHIHSFPSGFPNSGTIPASEEARGASKSKISGTLVRRTFDLELPADEYIIEEQKLQLSASTSADIVRSSKERLQRKNLSASSQASFHERELLNTLKTVQPTSDGSFFGQSLRGEMDPVSLLSDHHSSELQTSRKIFGVEFSHRNHNEPQLSLQRQAILGQVGNASSGSNLSFENSMRSPQVIEDEQLIRGIREAGSSYQMSTDSLLINFRQFVGMNKTKISIPHSLVQDSSSVTGTTDSKKRRVDGCSGNEKILGSYVGKFHSAGGVGSANINLMDDSISPESAAPDTKRGVEIEQFVEKNMNARGLSSREFLDLNVCPTEEDISSTICSETSHVKPFRGNIDLEVSVPEVNESPGEESTDSKQGSSVILDTKLGEDNDGLLSVAVETLVELSAISADKIIEPIFPDKSEDTQSETLQWFAEIITSSFSVDLETEPLDGGEDVPKGMDYFEFATLNLAEMKVEELSYKPSVSEEMQENLSLGRPQKGHARRGRQKKDFQKDVLPCLTSLSRNEVSEDLHTIEGMIKARGGASRTGPSQKNGASKGSKARGRTNKRNFTGNDPMNPQAVRRLPGVEEGTLMGWGKRARRPKRARCSAAIHSILPREVL
ncbi:uncharacterized protein LOC116208631 [Punica granatum]|uniref:Uncharacterized protein LOC116208631 n=2 Tax=Punica granatum TaxID=22663 RepID=A0A6P8DZZ7_PUNGR|nr:uncharacterized protein LOC116208631 [Punica granatum]XP_031398022.1 uncharacterized protein LOC116208631 [Punica granatum]XP_031398023.1 uncharacterized protein LOC116208631 [Punica granatum]XP_031398024.1 uncharacterized protein LOC116208631 [Punica granatum]PKI47931.1 hypothetical protein CRG98_031715 [Punica granatum]